MALATPRLVKLWRAEAAAVSALQEQYSFDAIVSDNRFGCRIEGVPSVVVTHQAHLPIAGLSGRIGNEFNQQLLRRFDAMVIPDYPPPHGLAGPMSAPLPGVPTSYLGPVSRFVEERTSNLISEPQSTNAQWKIAAVLSGPEPQRTILEEMILEQLLTDRAFSSMHSDILVVRGLPVVAKSSALVEEARKAGISVVDFLDAAELRPVLAKADLLVVRPGYTTVMDLAALGRKAVFIPTPAQPEQAWLGQRLADLGRGVCYQQRGLVLAKAFKSMAVLPSTQGKQPVERPHSALAAWATSFVSGLR